MKLEDMKALPPEEQAKLMLKIDLARKKGKATNYSATYGAGPATIARSAGISVAEAELLHKAYWKLNWSVTAVAEQMKVKSIGGQKWLFNPVSKMWYSLRHEKDRWSTLNQGTGVFCFDTWLKHVSAAGVPMIGQFHDEVVLLIRKGKREKCEAHLKNCVKLTNNELNLNRELDCSVDFGDSYAQIH